MKDKQILQIKMVVVALLVVANIGAIIFAVVRIKNALPATAGSGPISAVSQAQPGSVAPPAQPGGRVDAFAAALDAAGIEYTTSEVQYGAINAIDGRKFHIGEGVVEVYQFDKEGETYQSIMELGEGGFTGPDGTPVIWNDDLAMFLSGVEDEQAVKDAFDNL